MRTRSNDDDYDPMREPMDLDKAHICRERVAHDWRDANGRRVGQHISAVCADCKVVRTVVDGVTRYVHVGIARKVEPS